MTAQDGLGGLARVRDDLVDALVGDPADPGDLSRCHPGLVRSLDRFVSIMPNAITVNVELVHLRAQLGEPTAQRLVVASHPTVVTV
jgi:hypothetical protein